MKALLLDHTGSPIRPRNTRRAELVRRINARYDAAQTSTDNENHWQWADGLSAAAANSPDVRRTLRNRARYEVANNTYASGMVRTLANDTVGAGPSLQMLSGDKAADTQVETAFWRWMQAARIPDKLRTMRISRSVDGESFGLMFTNMGLRHAVKLDVRLYEADQVARPWVSLNDPLMSDGIFFDDFGNPSAYTLLRQHPGDHGVVGIGLEFDLVPARDMIHLFRPERPGQIRGIPEIMPALPLYAQLRRYTLAVIAAAETAADLAALLQTQAAPEDPDDIEPLDAFDLERRSILTLPRGWTAQQMKAEQPTTTYQMFKREIINEIARCLGMPYNIAAGDSSGYNYASGRLDHQTYFKAVDVDRDYLETSAMEPLFERWWEEASLIPGVLPDSLADLPEPPRHDWRWGGHEHVDPLKEANAQGVRLVNLTATLADECEKDGKDWEEVLAQRAKELGITVQKLQELEVQRLYGAPTLAARTAPPEDTDDGDEE